ncbi:MAG: CBS domain-containing protein [Chloroflexi bacterium]|nr:CBS domain-containing protein [Chloroflexota bacterium]
MARRGYHIPREYSTDPLELLRVGEVMDVQAPMIPAAMTVIELSDRIARNDSLLTRHQGTFIVDEKGDLIGIITRGDMVRALGQSSINGMTVLDAGSRNLTITYPDELLRDAVAKMLKNGLGRLPVVSRANPRQIVGYLGRANVLAARLRRLEEKDIREVGWFARFNLLKENFTKNGTSA